MKTRRPVAYRRRVFFAARAFAFFFRAVARAFLRRRRNLYAVMRLLCGALAAPAARERPNLSESVRTAQAQAHAPERETPGALAPGAEGTIADQAASSDFSSAFCAMSSAAGPAFTSAQAVVIT